jgi:hypothetical protein
MPDLSTGSELTPLSFYSSLIITISFSGLSHLYVGKHILSSDSCVLNFCRPHRLVMCQHIIFSWHLRKSPAFLAHTCFPFSSSEVALQCLISCTIPRDVSRMCWAEQNMITCCFLHRIMATVERWKLTQDLACFLYERFTSLIFIS